MFQWIKDRFEEYKSQVMEIVSDEIAYIVEQRFQIEAEKINRKLSNLPYLDDKQVIELVIESPEFDEMIEIKLKAMKERLVRQLSKKGKKKNG